MTAKGSPPTLSSRWREWAMGNERIDPLWTALTRAPSMILMIGLEHGLRPISAPPGYDDLDRGAVKVLESLFQTGAEIIIVSSRPRAAVDPLVRSVIGARWVADSGLWRHDRGWTCAEESLDAWVRSRLPSGPLLAIGDGLPLERFQPIAPFEVAFCVGPEDPRSVRRRLSGTTAVRAFLWWLIETRAENLGPRRAMDQDA